VNADIYLDVEQARELSTGRGGSLMGSRDCGVLSSRVKKKKHTREA
jgi:hypothetical protein